MFNETNAEEIDNFIPIIGLGAFIGILLFCCICKKTKQKYYSLSNNIYTDETHNNYDDQTNNNSRNQNMNFPNIKFTNQNNDKPPPYQNF